MTVRRLLAIAFIFAGCAPVSLLFFLTVMVALDVLSGERLHPMNYFFISAAFFAFHLLLAYLVDHISLHSAFFVAATVSVALVAPPADRATRSEA